MPYNYFLGLLFTLRIRNLLESGPGLCGQFANYGLRAFDRRPLSLPGWQQRPLLTRLMSRFKNNQDYYHYGKLKRMRRL